jgi:hypothetical protein
MDEQKVERIVEVLTRKVMLHTPDSLGLEGIVRQVVADTVLIMEGMVDVEDFDG